MKSQRKRVPFSPLIPSYPPPPFHERLRDLRLHLRLTQQDLADAVGVTQTNISYWESGTHQPKGKHIFKLAEVLGVAPETVAGWKLWK